MEAQGSPASQPHLSLPGLFFMKSRFDSYVLVTL